MYHALGRHDAFKHHADPMGLRHSRRVGMMHQYSTSELLAGAALVHHNDKYHPLVTSVLKGLMSYLIIANGRVAGGSGRSRCPYLILC